MNLVDIETTCPTSQHPASLIIASKDPLDSAGLDMDSIEAESCVQFTQCTEGISEICLSSSKYSISGKIEQVLKFMCTMYT